MKKAAPYIILVVLAIVVLFIKTCQSSAPKTKKETRNTPANSEARGLNRNPATINYSKHARCRMDCRKVTEAEVNEILKTGTINYSKSDLKNDGCQRKYAVEGYSKDKQHLRIIFAPCQEEVTVVTCIDLETNWECECEGD